MMKYDREIKLGNRTFSITGCSTREDAVEVSVEYLKAMKWRPAKWWEIWRKDEIPEDVVATYLQHESRPTG